jgi:hypothetical protein
MFINPQNQIFTEEEILKLCFSFPITKKLNIMYQETYKGCRPTLKGEYPTRTFKLGILRQAVDVTSVALLASHCTPTASILSEKKTYTEEGQLGNKSREFIVSSSFIGENAVKYCKISQELALRPTVIRAIRINKDAGFEEIQLAIQNESFFNETPTQVVLPTVEVLEDESEVLVFDLTQLTHRVIINGTTAIKLEGIGAVTEVNAEFVLGESYGIF